MELWTAFVLGAAGSLHCAGMCGPLLLALAGARPGGGPGVGRRLAYHAGRVAVYGVLGAVVGGLGWAVAPGGFQRWLSIALGLALLAGSLGWLGGRPGAWLSRWIVRLNGSVRRRLGGDSAWANVTLGALNGLLPCGLVYVAAAGAASTGDFASGAAYMAMFGLGTLPILLAIQLAGLRLRFPARLELGTVTRVAVLLMASLLILRGLELGVPFLSPRFADATGHEGRCH